MDIEKAFEIEASSYFKKKKDKDSKQFGISKKKSNVRHGGSGYRDEEVKLDERNLPLVMSFITRIFHLQCNTHTNSQNQKVIL